jgi:tRNA pseudouridine55 synthase
MKPSVHGLLVVDKPGRMTSRDAVNRALRWFPAGTRLGHTGTLDPLATGVLVLCAGVATRLAEYVQRMAKTYDARLRLGVRSDSDDADGTWMPVAVDNPPDQATIEERLRELVGEIEQVPPAYSAARVTGRRAYDLARRGREVSLEPRRVRIYAIELRAYNYPHLDVTVRCGKGTYIRSLARDLGGRLACGGLVETLRRTRVGPFDAVDALSLEADAATAQSRLLPPAAAVAELPRVTVNADEVIRLRQGQKIPLAGVAALAPEAAEVAVFDVAGALIAVAGVDRDSQQLAPAKVLPADSM